MTFRSFYLKAIQYISGILLKVALNTTTLTLIRRKKHVYPTIPIIDSGTYLNK
jgi:hypothetical protein